MVLSWEKDNRYYKLLFQPTLFGAMDVICVWGRVGGNLGGYKVISCATEKDVELSVNNIKQKRKYRGYTLLEV